MSKLLSVTFFVKYFWYIIIILALAIFFISYWGFAKPRLDLLQSGRPLDSTLYLEIIKKQKTSLASLEPLIKDYENLNLVRLEKLDQLVGAKADIPNTLAMVVRLVGSRGFEINDINFEVSKEATKINLSISGKDYSVFKELLQDIESSARLMDIKMLNFSLKTNNYNLQIITYHLE